ncbi:MAG: phage tail protein [Clostridia bacterium]|nr:phage tail protein [Clostridia bacterium]
MSANKIKYGLKNVHYSVISISPEGVVTYATPVKIPGAVTLTANAKGDKVEFYADDFGYFVAETNQGYDGSLEVALLPDVFKKDVMGWKEDLNGVLFEDSTVIHKEVALLFEFNGDKNGTRHVFYNVSVGRPSVEGQTKGQSIEVKTETINITASPASDTGYVKAKAEGGTAQYTAWYTDVYTFEPLA